MTSQPTIFTDGILDAHVNFGVVRLRLAQTGADGKPVPTGQLCIPLVQVPALVTSLQTLIRQVEARVKEQQAASAGAPGADSAAPPVPGAFRFG